MPEPLLTTKLYIPPLRADLVPRPHLVERLHAGLGRNGPFARRLTLLSAPAGFGKTTLLSEWVANLRLDSVGAHGRAPVPSQGRAPVPSHGRAPVPSQGRAPVPSHGRAPVPGHGRAPVPSQDRAPVPSQDRAPLRVAWLSLDEGDNELDRFLSYFVGALQTIRADLGEAALAVLQSSQQPSVQAILSSLINELTTVDCPVVLILDDYHAIEEQQIDRAVAFVLEHQPPNLHLVIAGRADPFLHLSRLRARGLMTELRADDLRFSPQETATLLNQVLGLGLSGEDLAALDDRTEGWITGLQLAARSIQDRKRRGQDPGGFIQAFAGDDRYIVDYLVDEVLAQRPRGTRDFMLRTSILDRMTGPLCDAVCFSQAETYAGQESGQQVLERLEQANLFVVPLDSQRRWYRYHHLFADLLRHRLRATDPDLVPELYRRASTWYETEGLVEGAIRYALAAEDKGRAARLLDEIAQDLVARAELKALLRWMDLLPQATCRGYPRLCLAHAWALQFVYQLDAVEPILALAEEQRENATYPQYLISANASTIRAYVARERGEYARALELTQKILDRLAGDSSRDALLLRGAAVLNLGIVHSRQGQVTAAGDALHRAVELNRAASSPYAFLSSVTHLMRLRVRQGRLRQAEALGRQGLEWMAERRGEGAASAGASAHEVHVDMSRVLYERNDLAGTADHVRRATELAELGLVGRPIASYVLHARLQQAQGDVDAALDYLQRIESHRAMRGPPPVRPHILAQIVRLQLLIYRLRPDLAYLLAEAGRWARETGTDPADDLNAAREYQHVTLARVRMAQDRVAAALPLLVRLCQSAASSGRNGDLIQYLIGRSLAHHALAQPGPALSALNQALVLAQPEGYVRSFVDEGEPMAELLHAASRQRSAVSQAYIDRLLAAFGVSARDKGIGQPSVVRHPSSVIEPLSDRERQVLQLLQTELSGPQIAKVLMVSVNTVRYHTKNIYGKLDVHSRRQAVARAESLGLL